MTGKWKVTAKEILDIGMRIHEFPTERVLNYHFTNEQGQTFRINLLDNGQLEISVDAQLMIYPRASNSIELELKGF